MSSRAAYTVTGPEGEKTTQGPGAAISCAQTRASRHAGPCTYYVRDPDGRGIAVAEKHDDGSVTVSRPTFTPGA